MDGQSDRPEVPASSPHSESSVLPPPESGPSARPARHPMAGPPVVRVTMTRPEYPADPYVRRPPARAGRVAGAPEPSIAGAPEEPPNRPGRPGLTAWRWVIAAGGVAVAAVVVVAVLAFRLGAASGAGPGSGTAAAGPGGATGTSPTVASTLPVTAVYSQVAQSVVLITTSKGAVGSGVVVTDTGTVLTANHVVSGGGTVAITFADGTRSAASVASTDKTTDMALLTPAALPSVVVPATLGGGLAVGSDVVAIGNPLGLVDSTTSGVVSGLNRTATTDAGTFSGLIQFDAAVNPGSSGGPLLDDRGLVVGIVVSIADPGDDDSFAGIGFAVPIATAVGGGGSGPGRGGGPQI